MKMRNIIWRSLLYNINNILFDLDGNKYRSVIIGTQEWLLSNLKVTKYANGDTIPYIIDNAQWTADITGAYCSYQHSGINKNIYGNLYNFHAINKKYTDWFLGSLDEMQAVYDEIFLYELGTFFEEQYWTSSEYDDGLAYTIPFIVDTLPTNDDKTGEHYIRPIRQFTAASGLYNLRDPGPAGGLIFIANGSDYYECSLIDIDPSEWSELLESIGTTGTDIGTGKQNTLDIINQVASPISKVYDLDNNEYRTVIIGSQKWIVENFKCTKYADNSSIPNITINGFGDWALPSKDELNKMWINLASGHDENAVDYTPIGDFKLITGNSFYWSSSEVNSTSASAQYFYTGTGYQTSKTKNTECNVRAFRSFYGTVEEYPLRSVGPAGGYIFAHHEELVYECNSTDFPLCKWSTLINIWCGNTQTAIGKGIANTYWMLNQTPQAPSAKSCDDYSNGWIGDRNGGYCAYNNDSNNIPIHGLLYNWHAVNNAKGLAYLKSNGIQEAGWRVPTEADFTALITSLGGDSVSGGKMKETGTAYWTSPNTGATNDSGFTALGSGSRASYDGSFDYKHLSGYFWSSTEVDNITARFINIYYNYAKTFLSAYYKGSGYSVRLVKDIT